MIEVIITNPEQFEKFMKIFKQKVKRDGFLMEIQDRKYYKKPSEIRRLAEKKRRQEKRD